MIFSTSLKIHEASAKIHETSIQNHLVNKTYLEHNLHHPLRVITKSNKPNRLNIYKHTCVSLQSSNPIPIMRSYAAPCLAASCMSPLQRLIESPASQAGNRRKPLTVR